MSKILKLKQWVTIPEAFNHIAPIFDNEIELSDIYRFILDGHLTLSVNFVNGAYGRKGEFVPLDEWLNNEKYCRLLELPDGQSFMSMIGENLGEIAFVPHQNKRIDTVSGIWDLIIVGNGQLEIEHIYYEMVAGVASELINLSGTYFKQENDGFELYEPFYKDEKTYNEKRKIPKELGIKVKVNEKKFDYFGIDNWYPSPTIPNNAIHCIKTSELERFIKAQKEQADTPEQPKRPTSIVEQHRNNLLQQIRANGLDPQNLVEGKGGKAGSKAQLKSLLVPHTMTDNQFKKTWESAMFEQVIQYKK